MFKQKVKTTNHISLFSIFPIYRERFFRLAKYGKLHNRIYK